MDSFSNHVDSPSSPARRCFAITPHDSQAIDPLPKAIRATGAGVITFRAVDSTVDIAHPVLDGERVDVRVSHVRATGTTVSVIAYA